MPEEGFKRKLTTFLIADIEGYSRLNEWFGATSVYRKGDCMFNYRIASAPKLTFEGLEPYDGDLSRTVTVNCLFGGEENEIPY